MKISIRQDIDPFSKIEGIRWALKRRILRKAMRQAIGSVVQSVKANEPKRTGALRISIGSKIVVRQFRITGITGAKSHYSRKGKTPNFYIGKVEQKFHGLQRSWQSGNQRFMQILERSVREDIEIELNKTGANVG